MTAKFHAGQYALCINDEGYGGDFTEGLTYTVASVDPMGFYEVIGNTGDMRWIRHRVFEKDFLPTEIYPEQDMKYVANHSQAALQMGCDSQLCA